MLIFAVEGNDFPASMLSSAETRINYACAGFDLPCNFLERMGTLLLLVPYTD